MTSGSMTLSFGNITVAALPANGTTAVTPSHGGTDPYLGAYDEIVFLVGVVGVGFGSG